MLYNGNSLLDMCSLAFRHRHCIQCVLYGSWFHILALDSLVLHRACDPSNPSPSVLGSASFHLWIHGSSLASRPMDLASIPKALLQSHFFFSLKSNICLQLRSPISLFPAYRILGVWQPSYVSSKLSLLVQTGNVLLV